jgi:intracellular multiplication protein IcmD
MAFAVAALAKFKQHKDNPTQPAISTPLALLFIGAALVFIPTIFASAGQTIFGNEAGLIGTTAPPPFTAPP